MQPTDLIRFFRRVVVKSHEVSCEKDLSIRGSKNAIFIHPNSQGKGIFILIEITSDICCAVCSRIHVSRLNSFVCLDVNPNDLQLLSLDGLKVTFCTASLKTLPSYLKSKDSFLLDLPFQKSGLNSSMETYVFIVVRLKL